MRILDLPLKKEWYEMIESGIKTEEYREIKPYWIKRLCNNVDKLWQCADCDGLLMCSACFSPKNYTQYFRKEKKDDMPRFDVAGIAIHYVHQLQHLLRMCGISSDTSVVTATLRK